MAELSEKSAHAIKETPKYYAEGMLKLYHLYIDMVESRIIILKKFIADGLTEEVKGLNQKMREKCSLYDNQYRIMDDQTRRECQMFLMFSPTENIYEFLDDFDRANRKS